MKITAIIADDRRPEGWPECYTAAARAQIARELLARVQLIRKDLAHRGAIVVQEDRPIPTPPREEVTYPKSPRRKKS